ncbi:MAG: CHASE3 domain-containing protein [Luteolibacter sp.]
MGSLSRNVKLRYVIPALIALAMVGYGVATSSLNTRDNVRDASRVAHTRDVLLTLQDTLRSMLDLETGQRGFVIVGDESYLAPYLSALKKVDAQVAALSELTKDNSSQQLRIGMIKEVINQRKKTIAIAIDVRRSRGLDAAAEQVRNNGGKDQMDRLRQLIDEMKQEELLLLDKRQIKLTDSLTRTNRTVVISGSLAIAAGLIGAVLLLLFLSARDSEEHQKMQREKAESADRAKSDFLAMMSHEIRTPMNAILGFGELLHDAVETPRQKHFAAAIVSSGNALLSLINDILDLSKIEAGKLSLHSEVVVISKFAENLQTLFSFRAMEKGISYTIEITPDVPALLDFDSMRLRQVLVNLIGNAIKFTNRGSVHVVIRAEPVTTDNVVTLNIEVADTGIGIPEEFLPEIFRPFYQVDSRQARQFQGTGLGLSISLRLVEAMSGTLSAESEVGKGSVFRVSLPTHFSRLSQTNLISEQESSQAPVDFDLLQPSKILVVDDEPLNRELIRNYFAGTRHEVIEAENGEQAVVKCLKFHPDVVLMDIRMPGMDGREALAKLRENEETRHIPLIAVTASSLLNSQLELKSIFDGFTDKPISRSNLFLELFKFIPAAKPAAPAPDETALPQHLPTTTSDLAKLRAALETLHQTEWPNLVKLVPAQGTMNFAARLTELAEQHSCSLLADHAAQLMNSAQAMDLNESGRLLRSFPQVIAEIRPSDD